MKEIKSTVTVAMNPVQEKQNAVTVSIITEKMVNYRPAFFLTGLKEVMTGA